MSASLRQRRGGLDPAPLAAAEAALQAPEGEALVEWMSALDLGVRAAADPALAHRAEVLGWVEGRGEGVRLTALGERVADPLREFALWRQRGGRIHAEAVLRRVDPGLFQGRRVVEIGSGFGCNLLSLAREGVSATGVELELLYLQFAPILARRAGLSPPPVVLGAAERLPLADGSADVVLAFGSLQYTDLSRAVAEACRITAPGGRIVLLQGLLGGFVGKALRDVQARPGRPALRQALAVLDSLTHELRGRRLRRGSAGGLARPVYPSLAWWRRRVRRHGMRVASHTPVGHEAVVVMERP